MADYEHMKRELRHVDSIRLARKRLAEAEALLQVAVIGALNDGCRVLLVADAAGVSESTARRWKAAELAAQEQRSLPLGGF